MITSEYLESRLIGAAINNPETLSILNPQDFSSEASQTLWRALRACRNKYQTLDVTLISDYLRKETGQDLSEMIQGYSDMAPETYGLVEQYAKLLIEITRKDRLDHEVARLSEIDLPVDEKIATLNSILKSVQPRQVKPNLSMKQRVCEVVERIETLHMGKELPGVKTGLPMFDQVTGGLQNQDLYIIAARPSIGKTAFACNLCLSIGSTAFISAEQPASQLVQRMMAIYGHIPAHKMRNPRKFDDDEWPKLTNAVQFVSQLKTQILDEPAPTIEEATSWAGKAVERGAKLIIVDYLQRMRATDRTLSTFDRISHVAMSLKEMARSYDIPVIALAQINRQGAQKPKMEHLKGSGDIEQEADLVGLLDRDLENDPSAGWINIEKNRHGPIIDIPLYFHKEIMKFSEVDQNY